MGVGVRLGTTDNEKQSLSIVAPCWSHIQSLTLTGSNPDYKLRDHQLSQILEACAPLNKLRIPQSGFSMRSFFSLERHFATLDYLDIAYCGDVPSWMSQSILSSCPRLVYFHAPILLACDLVQGLDPEAERKRTLDFSFENKLEEQGPQEGEPDPLVHGGHLARDLAQGRPWVCLGLKTLRVAIVETELEWHESIFKRISTLTELRMLDLGRDYGYLAIPSLDLRLKSGLGYLRSLTHLTAFYFNGTPQLMEECDLQWILDAFPNLGDITWNFHLRPKKNTKLCEFVRRHGLCRRR